MSALRIVGNAYATADLRYRVQRGASKAWYLYDAETRERTMLGIMNRTAVVLVAERVISKRATQSSLPPSQAQRDMASAFGAMSPREIFAEWEY